MLSAVLKRICYQRKKLLFMHSSNNKCSVNIIDDIFASLNLYITIFAPNVRKKRALHFLKSLIHYLLLLIIFKEFNVM